MTARASTGEQAIVSYTRHGPRKGRPRKSVEDRFWPKVDIRGPNDCWLWKAGKDRDSYGTFRLYGKTHRAHHIAFVFANDRWPAKGMQILHSCDNPSCVNPNHLSEGTSQDNANDSVRRHRQARGSTQGLSKFSEADIPAIRQRWSNGEPIRQIARDMGVGPTTIRSICHRLTWKHAP